MQRLTTFLAICILLSPVIIYIYTIYLAITLFLIPAFNLYFDLYGVAGTFLFWFGLSIVAFGCGYFFVKMLFNPPMRYQATYKRNKS